MLFKVIVKGKYDSDGTPVRHRFVEAESQSEALLEFWAQQRVEFQIASAEVDLISDEDVLRKSGA